MKYLLILIIFCSGCTIKNQSSEKNVQIVQNEDPPVIKLADFEFTDLEGNTFSAEKYKGKPVFMHFWATWCRPCIQEMPGIARVMSKAKDVQFVFPSDEQLSKIKKFKNSKDFFFNYLQLTSGFEQIGVSSLPTTYFFNSDGELIEVVVGAKNWDSEKSITALKNLSNQ
jgi:thiol-disulfide isomerase/thioredoxin